MSDHPVRDEIRLTDSGFYAGDPHRSFRWMREHAPVYWDATGQVWGVARYADVLAVSKNPQTFSNADGMRPDQPPLPNARLRANV
jgi:cytochrome P450 family 142 subfamily A polypeptide 1